MSKEKISSQEIIDLVASKLSVSKRVAEDFLKVLFAIIEEALVEGESVKIKNFGTFKLQWNEPRKSVNVQTGEEIILEGYHKVVFTPDSGLKDIVNEPFAHLEPIELDAQNEPAKPAVNEDETFDPLRIFNEQANEIKDILSEINALSKPKEVAPEVSTEFTSAKHIPVVEDYFSEIKVDDVVPEEQILTIPNDVHDTEEEIVLEVTESKDVVVTVADVLPEVANNTITIEAESATTAIVDEIADVKVDEKQIEPVIASADANNRVYKKKRKLRWLWFTLLIVLLLKVGFITNYYLSSATRCWIKYDLLSDEYRQKLDVIDEHAYNLFNKIASWFPAAPKETNVIVLDSVSVSNNIDPVDSVEMPAEKEPVDSLQILFDQPRVYKEFLGSEKIQEGSMLTHFAKRYYGKKEFWVYIYEANKDHIEHPDRIPMGTLIRVPKVDKRLIDANNQRCIDKAKELHDLYVGSK